MPMRRTTETITPSKAGKYLATRNEEMNRHISQSRVARYSRDMEDDRWYYTGDAIRFDIDGELIDGSHRLTAILVTGKSQKMDVIRGLPKEVFAAIDTGKTRGGADVFGIHGWKNPWAISAAVSWAWRYKTGSCIARLAPTNPEALDFIAGNPKLKDSVELLMENGGSKGILPLGMAVALHYLFGRKSVKDADDFIEKVIGGIGLRSGQPYYALRERLLLAKTETKHKMSATAKMAYAIKAWNFTREGVTRKQLRWSSRGNNAEVFPKIR